MKRNKLMIWIGVMTLSMMAGCGNKSSNTQSVDIVETIDKAEDTTANETGSVDHEQTDNLSDENAEEDKFTDLATADEVPQAEGIDESKFTDELFGDVKEINSVEKFVVISRTYIETLDDGSQIAAASVEGSSEEEMIKVYFTDEAEYLLETGKADGSNATQAQADFSDILIKDGLELKGVQDTTGTEFLASEVKIIRVID